MTWLEDGAEECSVAATAFIVTYNCCPDLASASLKKFRGCRAGPIAEQLSASNLDAHFIPRRFFPAMDVKPRNFGSRLRDMISAAVTPSLLGRSNRAP